jgi:hypothetical protein
LYENFFIFSKIIIQVLGTNTSNPACRLGIFVRIQITGVTEEIQYAWEIVVSLLLESSYIFWVNIYAQLCSREKIYAN